MFRFPTGGTGILQAFEECVFPKTAVRRQWDGSLKKTFYLLLLVLYRKHVLPLMSHLS